MCNFLLTYPLAASFVQPLSLLGASLPFLDKSFVDEGEVYMNHVHCFEALLFSTR